VTSETPRIADRLPVAARATIAEAEPLAFPDGATAADVGERAIVEWIRQRAPAPADVAVGIGDDAAVVEPARNHLDVLTTDVLVEDVHFRLAWSTPGDIGWKALAVNLSDLAAMGASPRTALLSLVLPPSTRVAVVQEMVEEMLALAAKHGMALVGGNISRSSGPLVVDVTAVGAVKRRRMLLRSGARPGDGLFVSGTLGAAAAGLAWLENGAGTADTEGIVPALDRYRRPEPRVRLGRIAGRARAASACIDLSDGLGEAVRQLAEASGVGARLDAHAVPVDRAAVEVARRLGCDALELATTGGDDYELLFAVPRRLTRRFEAAVGHAGGVGVTKIGETTTTAGVELVRDGVARPLAGGFSHFPRSIRPDA
jgi:thiamine-monophosphate kinase